MKSRRGVRVMVEGDRVGEGGGMGRGVVDGDGVDSGGEMEDVDTGLLREAAVQILRGGEERFIVQEGEAAGGADVAAGDRQNAGGGVAGIVGLPVKLEGHFTGGDFPHGGGEGFHLPAKVLEEVEVVGLCRDEGGVGLEVNEGEEGVGLEGDPVIGFGGEVVRKPWHGET